MHVLLPRFGADNRPCVWKPLKVGYQSYSQDNEHLIPYFQAGLRENMIYLINKPPKWNPSTYPPCQPRSLGSLRPQL
jgi:hypothetical protein